MPRALRCAAQSKPRSPPRAIVLYGRVTKSSAASRVFIYRHPPAKPPDAPISDAHLCGKVGSKL